MRHDSSVDRNLQTSILDRTQPQDADGPRRAGRAGWRCWTPTGFSRSSRARAPSPARSTPRSATCRSSARTATPTRAGTPRTPPFPDPAQLFVVPDHYVFRMLYSQGVPLDRPRRPARRRRPDRDRRRARSGAASPRTTTCSAAPRRGSGSTTRFETVFGLDTPALGRDRRRHLRPHRRLPRPAGVPPPRPVRALQHRGDRHHRERRSTTCAGTQMIRASGWDGRVVTAYRPDAVVDPDFEGFAANLDTPRRADRLRHRHLDRLPRRPPRSAAPSSRSTAPPLRPRPRHRPHREPLRRPRPRRSSPRRSPARPRAEEADAFRGQMLTEMAKMSLDDGLVLQIHPGSLRNHSAAVHAHLRPRQGLRHPDAHRLRPRAEAAARRGRHAPRPHRHPLHARRDHALARARAARRRLPGAQARPGLVVPRQPRGHAPLPRADHRDRRLLQHRRLQRRHPRLLLDPRPPRHGPPGATAPTSPRSSPPGGWRRTRPRRSPTTSPTGWPRRPTGSEPQGEKT